MESAPSPTLTVTEAPEVKKPELVVEPKRPELKPGFAWTANSVGKIPVIRDYRPKEHFDGQQKLYTPCSCGSGKKYKFCCKDKPKLIIQTG